MAAAADTRPASGDRESNEGNEREIDFFHTKSEVSIDEMQRRTDLDSGIAVALIK
jgi:hypothetical protein